MTPTREADGKSTARGNWKAVIARNMRNPERRQFIVGCVGKVLQFELSKLCSDSCKSILRSNKKDVDHLLKSFEWKMLLSEVKETMPVLLNLLTKCTKTPTERNNSDAVIAVIIAILAKHRRPQASLIQKIISILLYSGHCSKKVSIVHVLCVYILKMAQISYACTSILSI